MQKNVTTDTVVFSSLKPIPCDHRAFEYTVYSCLWRYMHTVLSPADFPDFRKVEMLQGKRQSKKDGMGIIQRTDVCGCIQELPLPRVDALKARSC